MQVFEEPWFKIGYVTGEAIRREGEDGEGGMIVPAGDGAGWFRRC